MLERPNICYYYDIQMCHSHSTRTHNAKELLTSSFQVKFLKCSFVMASAPFFFLSGGGSRGHIYAKY